MIDCSIIFPLLNEEDNIKYSYDTISELLKTADVSYEIIYVNDGSTDKSGELISELCRKDKKVKLISFSRNFGQQPAILAGLKYCKGKCAINMDIDLEEDPKVIVDMITAWKDGYKVVTVERKKRKDGIFKRFTAKLYYNMLKRLGVKNTKNLAEFRLLDRQVINAILDSAESNVYLKTQIDYVGFRSKTIKADRSKRKFGKTKYNFRKLLNTASKGIVSATDKPLYLAFNFAMWLGFLTGATLVTLIVLSILNICFSASLWLIPVILFSTTAILFVLGIIGMYLAYTYNEVRGRKPYIIMEKVNIDDYFYKKT